MNTAILVPAARIMVAELDDAYPGRGTGSDGSVASPEHSAANPSSDHEPGPAGSPSPGLVDAVDIDSDLVPGDQAASERAMYSDVIPRFQAHPSSQYWIHNDMICHRVEGWKPRSYSYAGPGRNRHTKHIHLNLRETTRAHNDTRRWGFKGRENRMELDDKVGHKGWPKRTIRNLFLDLWSLRDALIGDDKAPPIFPTSPLGRLLAMPAQLTTYANRPHPVTLSAVDREQITRDVTAAVIAALPEYGPRPNTP